MPCEGGGSGGPGRLSCWAWDTLPDSSGSEVFTPGFGVYLKQESMDLGKSPYLTGHWDSISLCHGEERSVPPASCTPGH